jgi:lysophospholipase L1-like esterase
MARTQATEAQRAAREPGVARRPGKLRSLLFLLALAIIAFSRKLIPGPAYDWLNLVPLLATLYVGYSLVALEKTFGYIGYVSRCLSDDPSQPKPRGSFLFSPWLRSFLLIFVLLGVAEFALRCRSYHRALIYERQGDLLFTPVPDQEYIEKISLTPSRTNSYGLRGGPVDLSSGQEMVLCLGDSITYGFGVDDEHTYPAQLQKFLSERAPGRFTVLNAGVDAYGITLMDQKFLSLWNQGVHPQVVIVGYSMNEGPLEPLVDSDARTKDQFEGRVHEKNFLRSFALYNLIVEKWARSYYDRMKKYMVPGTNSLKLSHQDVAENYEGYLQRLVGNLQSHDARPVFLLFCGFDGKTNRYDSTGPFQKRFQAYAEQHSIPLWRSEDALREGEPAGADLAPYFIDRVHMNERGCQKVAEKLSQFLSTVLKQKPETSVLSPLSLVPARLRVANGTKDQ